MKKFLSLALVMVLALSLSPSAFAAEPVKLKVWAAQEEQAMLADMVKAFNDAHPDMPIEAEFGVVGEPDAKTRYLEDPAAAADVFALPGDQILDLVKAGALYEVTLNKDAVVAANVPGAIEAATIGDFLYAYPMTADNGYFLYYDKSVLSEEDVKTLDGILAAANAKGKKVLMDVSNGWYIASFFLGAGGKLGIEDGVQTVDFNNERGVAAGEAIKAFTADPAFMTGDDSIINGGIGDTIAAAVTGAWNAVSIQEKLGDNYAATKLPTFTLDGEQVQMGSFAGFKYMGVNAMTENPEAAMALAEWLTNEENQLKRFEVRGLGPANIKAAENDAVKANVALAALAAQAPFAVAERDVLGTYWGPAEAFGTAMEAKDYSKDVKTLLDEMVANITGK